MTARLIMVGRRGGDTERWRAEREAAGLVVVRLGRDGRTLAAIEKIGDRDLTSL